ncbi:MAG: thioredoxin [Caldilineales bacterium]|nr:thioredoxin [Caldilineales bacterium]MCW5860993.1 thioredoxin [Caldilineales bacterium]
MPIDTPIYTSRHSIDRVLSTGLPLVLVFSQPASALSRQLDPTLNTLAGDYAGKVLFAKLDIGEEPELGQKFGISQLPSLVFIRNSRAEATAAGVIAEPDLRRWCDYLARGGDRPPVPSGRAETMRMPEPAAAPPAAAPSTGGKPITLTDATFNDTIAGDTPVLVDFWAPWCGPCRMVAPTVEALAREFDGKLVVGKLNVDENQRTAQRYGIMSIPTLMIFRQGKAIDQVVGALPAPALRQRVLPHVN